MQWQLLNDVKLMYRSRPTFAEGVKRLKKPIIRTFIWMSVLEIFKLVQDLPYKFLIDNLNSARAPLAAVGFCIAQSVIECAVRGTFVLADTWRIAFLESFRTSLIAEGHRKELELSMDWHTKHGTGEKEAVIAKNIDKVLDLVDSAMFEASPTIVLIVFTTVAMLALGWQYFFAAALLFVLYLALILWLEPHLKPMRIEYRDEVKAFEIFGSQITQNCRTIKAFGLERHFIAKLEGLLATFMEHEVPRHRRWLLALTPPELLLTLTRLSVQLIGAYLMYRRRINISSFILAVVWMSKCLSNYNRLTRFQHQFHRGVSACDELAGIFNTEPTVRNSAHPVWRENLEADIELRNVCFRYPESERNAVDNVNLKIRRNSVVAVIGKSGSGKTTLADLLTRSCDPTSGEILIGGIDLRSLDYERFRGEFSATVHQNAALFDTSVRENIRIAKPSAPAGAEYEAARMAYADEFIDTMADAYETLVGENGVRLSGGQKQRLSIARALMRGAKLLVLDEPTSALDGGSQQKIKVALARLTGARRSTIVIIAHRFSTIEMADTIIVMDQGRIVETGSRSELMRKNGFYARLRQLENEGALDEEDEQASEAVC